MGLFDFFKKKHQPDLRRFDNFIAVDTPADTPEPIKSEGTISRAQQKRELVRAVSTLDMAQFPEISYELSDDIVKHMEGHPVAFIRMNTANQSILKSELNKINAYIINSPKRSNLIPKQISIPMV